jgi:hypothetical protein
LTTTNRTKSFSAGRLPCDGTSFLGERDQLNFREAGLEAGLAEVLAGSTDSKDAIGGQALTAADIFFGLTSLNGI